MKTYKVNMYCHNCKGEFKKEFPFGTRIMGYQKCEICGCVDAKAISLSGKGSWWSFMQ